MIKHVVHFSLQSEVLRNEAQNDEEGGQRRRRRGKRDFGIRSNPA